MRKDKPTKQMTMQDFATNINDKEYEDAEVVEQSDEDISTMFDDEFNEKIKSYNKNIKDFGIYKDLKPRVKVLVRVFAKELEVSEGGLFKPHMERVAIPTKTGIGTIGEVESPYVYTRKAIVVGVPEHTTDIKVGDVVQLSEMPTKGIPLGGGAGAAVIIPNSFLHCDCGLQDIPVDPTDSNYGYLLVDNRHIELVL